MYVEDLTQKVAGERMGITQPNVTAYADTAIEKIDAVYEYIAWHNGELIAEELTEVEATV